MIQNEMQQKRQRLNELLTEHLKHCKEQGIKVQFILYRAQGIANALAETARWFLKPTDFCLALDQDQAVLITDQDMGQAIATAEAVRESVLATGFVSTTAACGVVCGIASSRYYGYDLSSLLLAARGIVQETSDEQSEDDASGFVVLATPVG